MANIPLFTVPEQPSGMLDVANQLVNDLNIVGTSINTVAAQSNIANANALTLPYWRRACARVRAGVANGRVLCIGDSTTLGYGSNGSFTGNMKPLSWPWLFAAQLAAAGGVTVQTNSFMGDGGVHGATSFSAQYDSRITQGSDWTQGVQSLGGVTLTAHANTSNPLTFLPTVNVDTFVVYYIQNSGLGVLSANINGGAPVTANTSGAAGVGTLTITGTLGSNTLSLNWSSGGSVYVIGVEAYNSAVKSMSVINAGWVGSYVADWAQTNTPYASANALPLIVPDLTIISLFINDWDSVAGGFSSVVAWTASMQTLITQALSVGDCVLLTAPPTSTSMTSQATQATFIAAAYALAAANNIPLIDWYSRWQSYAYSNNLGFYNGTIHPIGIGYEDAAELVFRALGNV